MWAHICGLQPCLLPFLAVAPVEFVPLIPSARAGTLHPGWLSTVEPPSRSRNNEPISLPP